MSMLPENYWSSPSTYAQRKRIAPGHYYSCFVEAGSIEANYALKDNHHSSACILKICPLVKTSESYPMFCRDERCQTNKDSA